MIKLNIGCGLKYKKDYVNIDAYDDTVADQIMFATDLKFDDLAVDLIECIQVIEHLGYMNTILALGEFYRVLNTHSTVIIETPDIDKTFELYLQNNIHSEKAVLLNWIFGVPPKPYEHKFCFPAGLLRKLLIEAGFVDIMENFHEKTYGMPSFNFIAKKPLKVNPNYLLIHNFRKRCFNEIDIFKALNGANYQLDFEKNVLNLTIDFKPRDFSVIDFNKLICKSLMYSIKSAHILLEECLKLSLIPRELFDKVSEVITILENEQFTENIYNLWHEKLLKSNDPEDAFIETQDELENLFEEILNTLNSDNLEPFMNKTKSIEKSIISNEKVFSYYFIESVLSRSLAKYIKGTANELESSLCSALITNM